MQVGIVTGADGGIGRYLTYALAEKGYCVVMGCRNKERGEKICEEIKQKTASSYIEVIEIDLSSFESINQFITAIYSKYNSVDVLLNNAGILCPYPQKTEENAECTIGVNYLGAYLLTEQLFSLMSKGTRIVNTVSLMLKYGKIGDAFFSLDASRYNRFTYYSHSKLALYYATLEWAEKWKGNGITVNCVDPGIVNTKIIRMGNKVIDKLCNLFFRPFIRTPKQGADTIIYLATDNSMEDVTGELFKNRKIKRLPSSLNNHSQRSSLKQQTQEYIIRYTDY